MKFGRQILIFTSLILGSCNHAQFSPINSPSQNSTAAQSTPFLPKMTMLMGANGNPSSAQSVGYWSAMGLRFSRVYVGAATATSAQDLQSKGYFDNSNDATILFNNANGISTLILMAYTPSWNSVRSDGDTKAAPKDESVWTGYIDAVVKHYSAPPFNVKHFQIWNEAAGSLSGGSAQATFWHGPGDLSLPYVNAMPDYVNLIHIPAAKIIRSYGAYVVYGGWPDQGGLNTYTQWLEYQSPNFGNQTMLDWTDYLDTHYLSPHDMEFLYQRYVSTGKIRGVWQSEIGFAYMANQNFVANQYFTLADMALRNGWSDPNQFVALVYHWSGAQGFMLMDFSGNYHDSGTSLKTLTSIMTGTLSRFSNTLTLSSGAKAVALYNDKQIVFQFIAPQGAATIDIDNLPAPAGYSIAYKEAVYGTDLAASVTASSWQGSHLSIKLNVPAGRLDLNGTLQNLMGYVILTPK